MKSERQTKYFNYLVLPLKFVASWEWFERPKDYQIIINYVYMSTIVFLLLNMIVSLAIHIYLMWQGIMSSLDILSEALPLLVSMFIVSYFSMYQDDLYELVEYINNNFKWHSASGVTNMTMQKSYDSAKRFAYFYTACTCFSVTVYTIIPIADHLTTNAALPWMYNGDVDRTFVILLIRQCLVQAIIGLTIGQLGVFFVTTSILLCGQLDLLCCSLRNVRYTGILRSGIRHHALLSRSEDILADEEHCFSYNESLVENPQFHFDKINKSDGNVSYYDIYDPTYDDDTCSAMEDCARVHQAIKEFKTRFEKFVSPLLVVRVIHCTVYLCTLLYTATVKFDLAILDYLFAVILDIFFYCYFGNQVIIQANRVSEAAYQSAWITMGVRPRRILLNILLSSRRPLVIRAGNFLAIDLQTFITILKTSFSYYTLLVNVNAKKIYH